MGRASRMRLYEKRTRLVENLRGAVRENREWLMESLQYPLTPP